MVNFFRFNTMDHYGRNLTDLLSIYNKPGKYLVAVNKDVEFFVEISQYMFSIFGTLAVIANLTIFLLIFKVNKSQKIYYLIQANNIFKLIGGLIYAFIDDTICFYCKANYYNALYMIIFKSYIVTIVADILMVTIGAMEILITLDRLSILERKMKQNFFKKQDLRCLLPVIVLVHFIVHSPDIFIINIFKLNDNLYYRDLNDFSNSNIYNFVCITIRTMYLFTILIIYIGLVISLLVSYNRFLERKRRLTSVNTVSQNENDLIKLILFQSSFNMCAAIFSCSSQVVARFEYKIRDENPTDFYRPYFIITKNSFVLIALCGLSIADIAIFAYDSRIQKLIQRKKVQNRVTDTSGPQRTSQTSKQSKPPKTLEN